MPSNTVDFALSPSNLDKAAPFFSSDAQQKSSCIYGELDDIAVLTRAERAFIDANGPLKIQFINANRGIVDSILSKIEQSGWTVSYEERVKVLLYPSMMNIDTNQLAEANMLDDIESVDELAVLLDASIAAQPVDGRGIFRFHDAKKSVVESLREKLKTIGWNLSIIN